MAAFVLGAFVAPAEAAQQNTGDCNVANASRDVADVAYSSADLLAIVACLEGQAFADELAAAIDPQNGWVRLCEQFTPTNEEGVSDGDTIMVNSKDAQGETRQTSLESAVVLAHEYRHVQHRGGAANDPVTNALPCGSCEHADMFSEAAFSIWDCFCGGSPSPSAPSSEDVCAALDMTFEAAARALVECAQDVCSSSTLAASELELAAVEGWASLCCQE